MFQGLVPLNLTSIEEMLAAPTSLMQHFEFNKLFAFTFEKSDSLAGA